LQLSCCSYCTCALKTMRANIYRSADCNEGILKQSCKSDAGMQRCRTLNNLGVAGFLPKFRAGGAAQRILGHRIRMCAMLSDVSPRMRPPSVFAHLCGDANWTAVSVQCNLHRHPVTTVRSCGSTSRSSRASSRPTPRKYHNLQISHGLSPMAATSTDSATAATAGQLAWKACRLDAPLWIGIVQHHTLTHYVFQ
jgi:hypothetical protein